MKGILTAIVFVALVVYVFISMLNHIPSIAVDLGHTGLGEGTNLYQMADLKQISGAGGQLMGNLQQGLQGLMKGKGGS